MFTMLGENLGLLPLDLASSGKKPTATKNCDETFVSKVSVQVAGSDFIK
jgi:hypothetical protein